MPGLVVSAPMLGGQGARVAPLLAALAGQAHCRFIVGRASERDLAPGPASTLAEWLDDDALDGVPHLHILADDAAAAPALRAALRRPGVTLLQDPGLAALYQSITLDAGQPEAWVRAMAAAHGGAGRRLARAQLAGLFVDRQRHWTPMLEEVADVAPLLVARSGHAAAGLPSGTRHAVLAESAPAAWQPDQAAARAALGLAAGPLLLVPMRAPEPLTALREAAASIGAALLPCLPADDVRLHAAACDGALGLGLPFGATPAHALAVARAAGRPVLAWEADPAAAWASRHIAFPANAAQLGSALAALLTDRPGTPATAGIEVEARDLLSLVAGCRTGAPAP